MTDDLKARLVAAEAERDAWRENAGRLAAQVEALWPRHAGECSALAAHRKLVETGQ